MLQTEPEAFCGTRALTGPASEAREKHISYNVTDVLVRWNNRYEAQLYCNGPTSGRTASVLYEASNAAIASVAREEPTVHRDHGGVRLPAPPPLPEPRPSGAGGAGAERGSSADSAREGPATSRHRERATERESRLRPAEEGGAEAPKRGFALQMAPGTGLKMGAGGRRR